MLGRNDVDPLSESPASEVAVLGTPVRRNLRFDFNQFGSAALTCAITGPMTSIPFVMMPLIGNCASRFASATLSASIT